MKNIFPGAAVRSAGGIAAVIGFVLLFSAPCLAAEDIPSPLAPPGVMPPLHADAEAAEYGRMAAAGLSWEDLAGISLWASGADEKGAPDAKGQLSYMDIIRGAVTELQAELRADKGAETFGERERGEYVLNFMFRKFLKNYSENQTRMDTLLSNGNYNCVSSAVFYVILARAAGLDAKGAMTRDHAFARIFSGKEEIDVETTNPHGFDPGNRKEFHDGFGRVTGFAYVPARNYRDRADIEPLELVALIFDNRVAGLESRGRFAEALSLALDREALLSSSTGRTYPPLFAEPRRMTADRIFNYGAALIRQAREDDALRWADMAAVSRPDETRWDELTIAALNNLFAKLIGAGRFAEAWEAFDANANRGSPEVSAKLSSIRKALAEAELSNIAASVKDSATVDEAAGVLKRNPRGAEPETVRELLIFLMLKKGEFIAKERGWQAAIAHVREAAAEYGDDRRFREQLRAFTANRIAELHNSFAAAYNRKDFENAQSIISAALEEFPGNRRFLEDKALAESAPR